MNDPPNDLCVLADRYLQEYQIQTLETAVAELDVDIPYVVVNDPAEPDVDPTLKAASINRAFGLVTIRTFLEVFRRERAWTFLYAERKLAEQLGVRSTATESVPVEEVACLADSTFRYVTPSKDGSWSELPEDAVDAISDGCDVAVRFGFGLLGGDVLTAPAHGVLSFHPADIRRYRGLGAPQAWLDDRDTIGVTLQRLTEDIDGGQIVATAEIDVSDCVTLWEVFDALHAEYPNVLVEGIRNLRDPAFEPLEPNQLGQYYLLDSRRNPAFAGRTLLKNLKGRVRRLIG